VEEFLKFQASQGTRRAYMTETAELAYLTETAELAYGHTVRRGPWDLA
jgi:hypothetical protein